MIPTKKTHARISILSTVLTLYWGPAQHRDSLLLHISGHPLYMVRYRPWHSCKIRCPATWRAVVEVLLRRSHQSNLEPSCRAEFRTKTQEKWGMQPSFDLLMIYQQDGYDVYLWSCLCCLSMNLYFDHSMTSTYPSTYLSLYDISTAEAEARFESLIIGISVSYFKSSLFDSRCWEVSLIGARQPALSKTLKSLKPMSHEDKNPKCPEAPQTSLQGFLGTLLNKCSCR